MKKVGSFFTLLTSRGYKKVVLIPLAFCLGFFLYSLYTNFDWYKEKLNATDDRAKGEWNGFDMDVSYSEGSKLFSITLKKQ